MKDASISITDYKQTFRFSVCAAIYPSELSVVGIVHDTGTDYDQQSAVTVMAEQTKAGCEIADRHRPVWGLESFRVWTPWPLADAYIR